MEQIKRNSREFKEVKKLIEEYESKNMRKRLIMLYSLKPSEDLSAKVLLNKSKSASVFFDLTYHALLEYFNDSKKKLFRQGNKPLYYFKNSALSKFIEMPFELKGKLKDHLFPLKVQR